MLNKLYEADGKRLNIQIWGQAGSGKTFFIEHTLDAFLKKSRNKNLRVVYISPKHEGILLSKKQKPVYDSAALEKSLRKERLTVFYPFVDDLEGEVDYAINLMFEMRHSNPDMKGVLIIDDAQVFLSSRKAASSAHRRLALTGRSRNIRGVYVSHNIVFAKELEGQISYLIGFSNPLPLYYRSSMERYGFDPEPYASSLLEKEHGFVFFNTRTRESTLMEPIDPKQL